MTYSCSQSVVSPLLRLITESAENGHASSTYTAVSGEPASRVYQADELSGEERAWCVTLMLFWVRWCVSFALQSKVKMLQLCSKQTHLAIEVHITLDSRHHLALSIFHSSLEAHSASHKFSSCRAYRAHDNSYDHSCRVCWQRGTACNLCFCRGLRARGTSNSVSLSGSY